MFNSLFGFFSNPKFDPSDKKFKEQATSLIPVIVKQLQKLGGKAAKKELKEAFLKEKVVPAEVLEEKSVSEKTGKSYSVFDFVMTEAVDRLIKAGYLIRAERGVFELTEKGKKCNPKKVDA